MQARTERFWLAGVCILAGALRLWDLDLIEFKGDEAAVIDMAMPLSLGKGLPLVGLMSSVGIHNPPMFIYLVALPTSISVDGRFVTGALIGGTHMATTALTYLLTRRRLGMPVAVLSATLFATSPWAVLYGRKLWAQDVLPLLAVATIWVCVRFWERPRTRWVAGLPILVCVLWQLHYSAAAVVLLLGVMLAMGARRIHVGAMFAGVVAAALLLVPYLTYQADHGYRDVRGLANLAQGKRATGKPRKHQKEWTLKPLALAASVVTDQSLDYSTGGSKRAFTEARGARSVELAGTCEMLALGLCIAGLWLLAMKIARRRSRKAVHIALGFWVFGFLTAMLLLRLEELYPHYFIMLFPAPFIVMALPLGALLRQRRVALRALAVALTGLLLAGNLATLLAFRSFIAEAGGTAGDYGVSYQHKSELAHWLVAQGIKPTTRDYAIWHLYRTVHRYGDSGQIQAALAERGPAPTNTSTVRIYNTLRRPDRVNKRCHGRQDFGPLVVCPKRRRP